MQTAILDVEYDLKQSNLLINNERKNNHTRSSRNAPSLDPSSTDHILIQTAHHLIQKQQHLDQYLQPIADENYIQSILEESNLLDRLQSLQNNKNFTPSPQIGYSIEESEQQDEITSKIHQLLMNDEITLKKWNEAKLEYEREVLLQSPTHFIATTTTTTSPSILQQWCPFFQKNILSKQSIPPSSMTANNNDLPCFNAVSSTATKLSFRTRRNDTTAIILLQTTSNDTITMSIQSSLSKKKRKTIDVTSYLTRTTPNFNNSFHFIASVVWLELDKRIFNSIKTSDVLARYLQKEHDSIIEKTMNDLVLHLIDTISEKKESTCSIAEEKQIDTNKAISNDRQSALSDAVAKHLAMFASQKPFQGEDESEQPEEDEGDEFRCVECELSSETDRFRQRRSCSCCAPETLLSEEDLILLQRIEKKEKDAVRKLLFYVEQTVKMLKVVQPCVQKCTY